MKFLIIFLLSLQVVAQPAPKPDPRLARLPFGVCSRASKVCKYWRPDPGNNLASREELFKMGQLEKSIYVEPARTKSLQVQFARYIQMAKRSNYKNKKCVKDMLLSSAGAEVSVDFCSAEFPQETLVQLKAYLR